MNIPLLEQVKAHILTHPKALDMSEWWSPNCQTVGCIAGWGCALAGQPLKDQELNGPVSPPRAVNLFGLSDEQALRLFHVDVWPKEFSRAYDEETCDNDRPEELARITAERIDHFIATDGRA
jgi:hypothetical protein